MKRNIYIMQAVFFASIALLLFACKKNGYKDIGVIVDGGARIKLYQASYGAPGINLYVNNNKITAVLSTTGQESATGLGFSATFPANDYAIIDPAKSSSIKLITPAKAAVDPGLVIASATADLDDRKYYSFIPVGAYDAVNKKFDMLVINDVLPAVLDTSKAYVRIVNAIPNMAGGANIDIGATLTSSATPVPSTPFTNIAYKQVSDFIALPRGAYDFYVRAAGDPTNLTVKLSFTLNRAKVYTLIAKGNATLATGATARSMDYYTNK